MEVEINGKAVSLYKLSEEELVRHAESSNMSDKAKLALLKEIKERFKSACCKQEGETSDDVFARTLSRFVNGRCVSKERTASLMAKDHRYLQQQVFLLFMEYVRILADNYRKGWFDARNEWSCRTSASIIDLLEKRT